MSTTPGPAPARDGVDLARGFRFVPEDPDEFFGRMIDHTFSCRFRVDEGALTIRDVSVHVSLSVRITGIIDDSSGNIRVGIHALT